MAARRKPKLAARKIDADRVVNIARSVTYQLSRAKTLTLWRNVVSRFPKEVAFAKQYVTELLLTETWADLDTFEPDARRHRSWELDLDYLDAALARLDIPRAQRLVRQYERRFGNSADLKVREYALSCLERDFATAQVHAEELAEIYPERHAQSEELLRRARFYERVADRWSVRRKPLDYDVFVINLDADKARLERIERQLADTPFERVPGVKGAYVPDFVLSKVSQNMGQTMKGTMGCFMSHIAVWERVIRSNRPALVLEDDAAIIAGLPPKLSAVPLPEGFHLVFVNERMHPQGYAFKGRGFAAYDTDSAANTRQPDWSSAGTDGYFISPKGAKVLLELVDEEGIAGDIDWRLVSFALNRPDRRAMIARGGTAGTSIQFHEQFRTTRKRLKSYVLVPSLVRQFAGGSVRLWDNLLPHAHMAQITKILAKRR